MQIGTKSSLTALALFCSLIPPASGMGAPPSELVNDQVKESIRTLWSYWRPLKYVPIIVPSGQDVGETYDFLNSVAIADRATCFPVAEDKIHRGGENDHAPLPKIKSLTGSSGITIALGLPGIGSIDLSHSTKATVDMSYTEATYRKIFVADLSRAFARDVSECKRLTPLVDGTVTQDNLRNYATSVVLAEVVSAKRTITIHFERAADADASIAEIAKIIPAIPGNFKIGPKQSNSGDITIESTVALPVAFKPAWIPMGKLPAGGLAASSGGAVRVTWAGYRDDAPENALDSLASALLGQPKP